MTMPRRGLHISLLSVTAIIVAACSTTIQKQIMPVSKEATCVENISGKEFKYLAWGIGADNALAAEDALKCGLYAALVGGAAGGNCLPLLGASERETSKEFINSFFADESSWRSYIRATNPGKIEADRRIKMNDGRVKLGVDVVVATTQLRQMLEAKGIVKKFEFGR
jgi:hypothetical protein